MPGAIYHADEQPDEWLARLQELLYGWNYCASFYLYGPLEANKALALALKHAISNDVEIADATSNSPEQAKAEMLDCVLYEGTETSGPDELDLKRDEIISLLGKIFSLTAIAEADFVTEFRFLKGHPAYPVFWDFAYDIHAKGERWVFVGSSSD
jgi:hypothetical protein